MVGQLIVDSPYAHIEDNAVLTRIFARLPEHMRASFTPEQMHALAEATYDKPTAHSIAIRKSIPFFGSHYYLAVFAGPDRRRKPSSAEAFIQRGFRRSWRYNLARLGLFLIALLALYILTVAFAVGMTTIFATDTQNSPGYIRDYLN